MFTLVTDNGKYLRVRRGVGLSEAEKMLCRPADNVFAGAIVERGVNLFVYAAKPLETYASVAKKFGVEEEELKSINLFRPVYPTRKIYVPRKNTGGRI